MQAQKYFCASLHIFFEVNTVQETIRPFSRKNLFKTAALITIAGAVLLIFRNTLPAAIRILFGACLIAFLITPIAAFFEKKLRRPHACLLALALVILVLLTTLGLLLPILARQLSGIPELLPAAFSRIRATTENLSAWLKNHFPGFQLPGSSISTLENNLGDIAKRTISYAGSIAGGVYQLVLTLILSYFLMADRDKALLRAELFIPSPWRRTAVRLGANLMREMRLYLRGQATIALSVAILAGVALTIIGVQAAPLLGAIVGLFNVIPYFGPFIGGIPAVIMALSTSWQKAAFTVLALFVVQQIDGLVLSPRIMGSITGFSPGIVLLAIFLGQQAFGIWGMLMAMPLMMGFRTAYRVFVQRHENN